MSQPNELEAAYATAYRDLVQIHRASCEAGKVNFHARLALLIHSDLQRHGDAVARGRATAALARGVARAAKHVSPSTVKED